MSTGREESSRYDGGSGAGGKLKKQPFRRTTQATPYDRPPTAIRNPGNGDGNGWLSKLVDPAQRLITYSANRLFASVFRKRLPAPPPLPQPPETNQETEEDHPEAASTDPPVRQEGAPDKCANPCNLPGGEFTELEHILKKKTFTRAEIDHLTNVLRSRTFDNTSGTEERRSEVKLVALCDSKGEFPNTPVRENGTERHSISTPAVISNGTKVLNEDVASPAELAKAYMDGRPSKNSVPLLSLHSQAHRENSSELISRVFPSKPPVMSLVPSGHVGGLGNGFLTPRFLGRSAIYNMARTPYSRANKTAALKSAGPTADAVAGPSSSSWSQSAWEQSRLSVSRQPASKRRLDNDIGSVGPIRRIRQKSNLVSQRSLGLPASESPLSIHECGSGSVAQNSLSLIKKPFLSGEAKDTFTKTSTENGINGSPVTSFTPVPSKSSQMASKILQQLNELVSTREKSPTKFSQSMLSGLALKNLETMDSSKFLENSKDKVKVDGATLPVIQDSMSHKLDKVEEKGRTKPVAPPDKLVPLANGIGTFNLLKANVPSANTSNSLSMKSVVDLPHQKKQAFQMSAHEDFLDLDDDSDHLMGAASTSFTIEREKLDNSVIGSQNTAIEAIRVEKPAAFSGIKPPTSSALNQTPNLGTYDGSMIAEQKASTTAANLPTTSQPAVLASQSTSTIDKPGSKESDAALPVFSSGEKTAQTKEQNATVPTFSFGSAAVNKVQSVAETSGFKFDGCLDSKLRNSSSFESVATAANHVAKSAESDQADSKNTLKAGFLFSAPETASSSAVPTTSSTGNIFKFGVVANTSNGSFASSPSPFSSQTQPSIPNKLVSQNVFSVSTNTISTIATCATAVTAATAITATTSSNSPTLQASVCSFTSAANFKFASPVPSSNHISPQIASSSETTEAQTRDTKLATTPFACTSASSAVMNNASSSSGGTSSTVMHNGVNPFSGLSSTATKAGSNVFGTSVPVTSTCGFFGITSSATPSSGSGIFSSTSASTSMVGSVFGFSVPATTSLTQSQSANSFPVGNIQSSVAGSGVPTSTQSMPIQSLSPASSPSFGVAGNTTFSSGGSLFGLSTSALPSFGSVVTFGQSSSSSVSNAASTSSATTSSLFGSSWPAPKTPIFGSTFNSTSSSTGFSFGASSTSMVGNASAPTVFGSSNIASSSSIFPFTSPAAATPSQPVFGSNTPGFAFGSAPSSNNDQMEDGMAEDTVQAVTLPAPVFGQQAVTPPSSGFIFGATPPAGGNPFQFGSQQNAPAPQNPSPFQPSGSLEFNAGGSFSLGSGSVDKSARKIVRVKSRQRRK